MSLAPWRSPLARALHRNRSRPDSRYPQLATLRSDGRPANRTVVFRDFLPETNSLLFVTDSRSDKVGQINQQPAGELCWYFTQTREQFRLAGHLQLVTHQDDDTAAVQLRGDLWAKLSASGRQQFAWPQPGHPRTAPVYEPKALTETSPLETFAVLVFDPDMVDHLELRGDPQNRCQYWRQGDRSWQMQSINP